MKKDSLGDRMKNNYENRSRHKLIRRMPVILRLDGKAFHILTRGCEKPFDARLRVCMERTAIYLCSKIQGAKLAYVQSDEISILLTDFNTLKTDAWFDYNIQKMCSISAGYASACFSDLFKRTGIFDCRAFNIPKEEVCNYFIWRQQDWVRNSLQMLVRTYFSHKELHKKNTADMHEMLFSKIGINWADIDPRWKNGSVIEKADPFWNTLHTPIFTQDRNKIDKYLIAKEE